MNSHPVMAAVVTALVSLPHPAAAQQSYGLPECQEALPGSTIEAAVNAAGLPIVCEARPAGAPSYATGEWDGSTIHLWVAGWDPRVVRKVAAHELGHWFGDHAGHVDAWAAMRGGSGQTAREDFAECFSAVNFPEPGVGYSYYLGPLTPEQRQQMQSWWAPVPVDADEPTTTTSITAVSAPVVVPRVQVTVHAPSPSPAAVSTVSPPRPADTPAPLNLRRVAVLRALEEVA